MSKHRHRGFLCNAGLWRPQINIQIAPLRWGIGLGFSRTMVGVTLGPVSVTIWFTFGNLSTECRTFNDPKV